MPKTDELKACFLKVSKGQVGQMMVQAEFESTRALRAVYHPKFATPIAWATFAQDPQSHFYLATFQCIQEKLPDMYTPVTAVARIHQLPSSSNGQFRFYVTTYAGIFPVNNTWCDTWEKHFKRMMRETVDYESAVHKHDEDLIKLTEQLVAKIIPRLLRPLETGGRKIKPCLVHGHFWHGNVATHSHFRKPMLLDPCALYAHNEGQCPDRLLVSRSWLTLPPACPEIQEQP